MRTTISFTIAIFIHLAILFFLLPKKEFSAPVIHQKYSTINLAQFNIQKKSGINANNQNLKVNSSATQDYSAISENKNSKENFIGSGNSTTIPSGLDSVPTFITFDQPEYPKLARIKGIEGKVKIKVYFNTLGEVSRVDIIESSSHAILDEAVKKAASKWKTANKQISEFEKVFEFKLNN